MIWIVNGLEARLTPVCSAWGVRRTERRGTRWSQRTCGIQLPLRLGKSGWNVASMICAYTWYRVTNILANTCVFNPRLELHTPYRIRLRAFKSALSMHSLSRITYLTLELSPHNYSTYSATPIIVMYSSGSNVPCMMPL